METIERVELKHNKVLKTFNAIESILAPIHTGRKSIEIMPFNLERLARHSDLLSNELLTVRVVKEPVNNASAKNYHVEIAGETFGYMFSADLICEARKRAEKSFTARQMSIKTPSVLINDSNKVHNDTKKVYICTLSEGKKPVQQHEKIQVNETNDELKTVNFQIEGKYIDQIKAGTKVEDYRAINPVNAKKLCEHIDKKDLKPGEQFVIHFKEIWRLKKDLTHVRFFNGYKTDRKELLIEIKGLELNKYTKVIPEGMKPGTICFTLILGQIVVSKNFKDENQ